MRHSMLAAVKRILILGGTREAAALAQVAGERLANRAEIIYSLAGRLTSSPSPDGALRVGGFGGVQGLQRYLREARIDVVVDATHPFATRIAHHAAIACAAVGAARLMLKRPAWQRSSDDHWIEAATVEEAASLVSTLGRRVFLTTGLGTLHAFARHTDIWYLVRLIEPPATALPLASYKIILARPPFSIQSERQTIMAHRVDLLVSKNSGGITDTKLVAARQLRVPVLLISRPPLPDGTIVTSVDAAIAWLEAKIPPRENLLS